MPEIGFLYAIGAAIIWGLVYAIDQRILADVPPITFLFILSIISAFAMLPFVLADTTAIRNLVSMGRTPLLILLVGILGVIANLFIFSAIKNMGASTASIIEIAYPFFVVLFSYILFRSTPNIYFILGGILVFVGSAIIIRFAS